MSTRSNGLKYRFEPIVFCLLMALSTESQADELTVWAGAGAANLNTLGESGLWGAGAQLGTRLGLNDFWSIALDAGGSYHPESGDLPAEWVALTSLNLRYNLDVFSYVPWLGLGPTFYLDTAPTAEQEIEANVGAKLSLGVDWRTSRESSWTIFAEIHALSTDLNRYPVYSWIGVAWNYHFRL